MSMNAEAYHAALGRWVMAADAEKERRKLEDEEAQAARNRVSADVEIRLKECRATVNAAFDSRQRRLQEDHNKTLESLGAERLEELHSIDDRITVERQLAFLDAESEQRHQARQRYDEQEEQAGRTLKLQLVALDMNRTAQSSISNDPPQHGSPKNTQSQLQTFPAVIRSNTPARSHAKNGDKSMLASPNLIPLAQRLESPSSIKQERAEKKKTVEFNMATSPCGGFYLSPNCLKNVPIAKIEEKGEYWVETWETYESMIQKIRDAYKQAVEDVRVTEIQVEELSSKRANDIKLKGLYVTKEKLTRKKNGLEIQEINAQKLVQYFRYSCSIHPNQLLSKEFINGSVRSENGLVILTTLDSLRRLLHILERAKDHNIISMEPITFLRKGLWRKIRLVGREKFALKATLKALSEDSSFVKIKERLKMIDQKSNESPAATITASVSNDGLCQGLQGENDALPKSKSIDDTEISLVKQVDTSKKLSTAAPGNPFPETLKKRPLSENSFDSSEIAKKRIRHNAEVDTGAIKDSKTTFGDQVLSPLDVHIPFVTSSPLSRRSPRPEQGARQVAVQSFDVPARPWALQHNTNSARTTFAVCHIHVRGFSWTHRRHTGSFRLEWNERYHVLDPLINGKNVFATNPDLVIDPNEVKNIFREQGSGKVHLVQEKAARPWMRGPSQYVTLEVAFFSVEQAKDFVDHLLRFNNRITVSLTDDNHSG